MGVYICSVVAPSIVDITQCARCKNWEGDFSGEMVSMSRLNGGRVDSSNVVCVSVRSGIMT